MNTVSSFRGLRVLVIGDAMLDSYLEGRASRLCSEGPVPIVERTEEEHYPGGAANTAANIAALGAEVDFVSVCGPDVSADQLRSCLRSLGVGTGHVVVDATATTIRKLRIVAQGQYVVRFDEGKCSLCSSDSVGRVLQAVEEGFKNCDAVVVSDYDYGTVSEPVLQLLKTLRKDRPVPMFVDSKNLQRFRNEGATFVTPNQLEAVLAVEGTLARDRDVDIAQAETVADRLLALIDATGVVITLGADGVLLATREGIRASLPARHVANAQDVGAGDTFLAAFALVLTAGGPAEAAAMVGIEAAGLAVAKPRTVAVTQRELLQRLSSLRQPAEPSDALAHLNSALERRRRKGKRIVFTNGVFDILHAGHVQFLRAARDLGDVLVVGVNSDASARRLKGRNRPVTGEGERLALVSALESVDHAVLFDEDEPSDLIRRLRPDIHVKGGDYCGESLPEAAAVQEVGGRIELLPLVGDISTSGLIQRIASAWTEESDVLLRQEPELEVVGA